MATKDDDIYGLFGNSSNLPLGENSYTLNWDDISGKPDTATRWPTYDNVTDKPTEFTPEAHTQGWDTITGKPTEYTPEAHTQDWSTVTGKPTTFTPSTHTQDWSTITGTPSFTTRWPTYNEVTGKPDLLVTGSYGLGTITQPEDVVFEDATQQATGFSRDVSGDAFGFTSSVMNMRYNIAKQAQVAVSTYGTSEKMAFRTMHNNGTWGNVNEVYHSGNSVNPKDYGIGGYVGIDGSIDDLSKSGLYGGFGGSHSGATAGDNPFPNLNGAFTVQVIKAAGDVSGQYISQQATALGSDSSGLTIGSIVTRGKGSTSNDWSDWSKVLTDANTNQTVWESEVPFEYFALGHAVNGTTSIRILIPINLTSKPSSLTLSSGLSLNVLTTTFSGVQDVLASGNLSIRGDSSSRVLSLNLAGLTGLTSGAPYYIRFTSAGGKITLNQ